MTWDRQTVADALVAQLADAFAGTVTVFAAAPLTVNPPAVVVGRPTGRYAEFAFTVDEMQLPVVVVGAAGDDDGVDVLAETVRQAVQKDPTIGGAVVSASPFERRNPRNQSIGGIEVQTTEVVLSVRM